MSARSAISQPALGRYTVFGEIASGGMATIQYARLIGPGGFSRAVAIKRLHPQFAKDQSFVSMFLDEARLSARIAHANVVQTLDIIAEPDELSVVMEYVHGESLARLLEHVQASESAIPAPVAVTLLVGILHGLHAAHETHGEHGEPLHIVHRDVSPENILVGSDGLARLLDFGIARAQGRSRVTPAGELKGKLAYMAPEQFKSQPVDRRVDVYGASVVLWEALTGRQLFRGETDAATVGTVMTGEVAPPSRHAPSVPEALDTIVMRGLSRDRDERFETARQMALTLEHECGIISQSRVSDWLEQVAGNVLRERAERLRRLRREAEGARASEVESSASQTGEEHPATPASLTGTRKVTSVPAHSGLHVRRSHSALIAVMLAALVGVGGGMWWLGRQHSDGPAPLTREPTQVPTISSLPSSPAASPPPTPASSAATVPPLAAPATSDAAPAATPVEPAKPIAEETAKPAAVEPQKPGVPSIAKEGEPPATTNAAPRVIRGPRGRIDKPASGPAARRSDCSDPFTVDALGIRHVKPDCLD